MTTLKDTKIKCLFEVCCMPHYFGPPGERQSSRYDILEERAILDMVCEPTFQAVKVIGVIIDNIYIIDGAIICRYYMHLYSKIPMIGVI